MPDGGGLRSAARVALIAGAAGSIALMMRAGARQRSILLIVLFAGWVLSPFLALALANLRAARWPARVRTALYAAMIGVSCLCLAIYGMHARQVEVPAGAADEQVTAPEQRVRVEIGHPQHRVEGQGTVRDRGVGLRVDRIQPSLDEVGRGVQPRPGDRQRADPHGARRERQPPSHASTISR